MAAGKIDAVQGHPDPRRKCVQEMCLNRIDWRLRSPVAAEEIGVVAEECHAGGDLECPGTPSLGEAQFRLERPAIVAEVEQLAVVVLSKGRGNLKTYTDDKILLITREVFCRQRGRTKQIEREPKPGVAQAGHLALSWLAVH